MTCNLCGSREPQSSLQTTFSDLRDAAELGCPFCSVIRDGIVLFANSHGITNISVSSLIEERRESQLGRQRPLCVDFDTQAEGNTALEFYTVDGQSIIFPSQPLPMLVESSCWRRLILWITG